MAIKKGALFLKLTSRKFFIKYINSQNFTEGVFVFHLVVLNLFARKHQTGGYSAGEFATMDLLGGWHFPQIF